MHHQPDLNDHRAFNQLNLSLLKAQYEKAIERLYPDFYRKVRADFTSINHDGALYQYLSNLCDTYPAVSRHRLDTMALVIYRLEMEKYDFFHPSGMAGDRPFSIHNRYFNDPSAGEMKHTRSCLEHELAKPKSHIAKVFRMLDETAQQEWIDAAARSGIGCNSSYRIAGMPTNLRRSDVVVDGTVVTRMLLHGTPIGLVKAGPEQQEEEMRLIKQSVEMVIGKMDRARQEARDDDQLPLHQLWAQKHPILTHVRELSPTMFNLFAQDRQTYREKKVLEKINSERRHRTQPEVLSFTKPVNTFRLLSVDHAIEYKNQKKVIDIWCTRFKSLSDKVALEGGQYSTLGQRVLALRHWLMRPNTNFFGNTTPLNTKVCDWIEHLNTHTNDILEPKDRRRLTIDLRALIALRISNQRSYVEVAIHWFNDRIRDLFYNPKTHAATKVLVGFLVSPLLIVIGIFRSIWHLAHRRWCPIWKIIKTARIKGKITADPDIMLRFAMIALGILAIAIGVGLVFFNPIFAIVPFLIGAVLSGMGVFSGYPLHNRHVDDAANIILLSDASAAGCKSGRDRTEWVSAAIAQKATHSEGPIKKPKRPIAKGSILLVLGIAATAALITVGIMVSALAFPFLAISLMILVIGLILLIRRPGKNWSKDAFTETLEACKTTRKGCAGNNQPGLNKTICLFTPEYEMVKDHIEDLGIGHGAKGIAAMTSAKKDKKKKMRRRRRPQAMEASARVSPHQAPTPSSAMAQAFDCKIMCDALGSLIDLTEDNRQAIARRVKARQQDVHTVEAILDNQQISAGEAESMAIAAVTSMVRKMKEAPKLLEVTIDTKQDPDTAWQEVMGYCKACHRLDMDLHVEDSEGTEWVNTREAGRWSVYQEEDESFSIASIKGFYDDPSSPDEVLDLGNF